ncbi:MAG TPA: hypothetical protein VEI97_13405 [bacterium]|nr:hypothetical protein [bacterium]
MRALRAPLGLALLLTLTTLLPAAASPRFNPGRRPKPKPAPADRAPAPSPLPAEDDPFAAELREPEEDLTPARTLANMLLFELAQGIQDYTAEVVETTTDARTGTRNTVRKELYFLAPARNLTLVDGVASSYIDTDLFGRFLDGVDLSFQKGEVINGVPCHVVKVVPREGAFRENVKYYYVAQDDFRKIRIRAIKTDFTGREPIKYWFTNDFSYRTYEGKYTLPLTTDATLATWTGITVSTTKAAFNRYQINTGLREEFFTRYLKDAKFNDTFKD